MTPPAEVRRGLRPTRIEVDLTAIRHNIARFRSIAGTQVCAVVKADGYGHGAVPVARAALAGGANWLAVALVEEGLELRQAGIDAPILLLSEPPVAAIPFLLEADLTPTVYRAPFIATLDAAGHARGEPVDVHLKADTGMARVGVPESDWAERLEQVAVATGIRVTGVQTHLARADEPDATTTEQQMTALDRFLDQAAKLGIRPDHVHASNSAGALLHERARRTLIRPGIAIYGLSPGPEVDAADFDLRPALRLVSEVGFAKRIVAGTPVSYGYHWRAPRDGWLATVPIGYADGVPRAVSNRAEVLVGGRRRAIVGRVCMDQTMVWCDQDVPEVGEPVVLLGAQGEERIRVEEWADAADTITYEIVTQLTARVPRHHLDDS